MTTPDPQDPARNFERLCAAWWDAAEYIAERDAKQSESANQNAS